MSLRVRAPIPAHAVEEWQAVRQYQMQQRAQQAHNDAAQQQQDDDVETQQGRSNNALVNIRPLDDFPEKVVGTIRREFGSLESAVRLHDEHALNRASLLLSKLTKLLNTPQLELDPEVDVDAVDLQTRMDRVIKAARHGVFQRSNEAKVSNVKDQLAFKWSVEDHRAKLLAKLAEEKKIKSNEKATTKSKSKKRKLSKLSDGKKEKKSLKKKNETESTGSRSSKRTKTARSYVEVSDSEEHEESEHEQQHDEDDESNAEEEEVSEMYITPRREKVSAQAAPGAPKLVTPPRRRSRSKKGRAAERKLPLPLRGSPADLAMREAEARHRMRLDAEQEAASRTQSLRSLARMAAGGVPLSSPSPVAAVGATDTDGDSPVIKHRKGGRSGQTKLPRLPSAASMADEVDDPFAF